MTRKFHVMRKTGVMMYEHGQPVMRYVGVASMPNRPDLFGLLDQNLEMTFMCYAIHDGFEPEEILKRLQEKGDGWFRFYSTGSDDRDIKISFEWLEKAFQELGIL